MSKKTDLTSALDLEEATKIIALDRLSGKHDHSLEKPCEECKAIDRKKEEYECRYEIGWHFLSSEARGYFQGFKDGANCDT